MINLHLSLKQRRGQGRPSIRSKLVGQLFSLSSLWPDNACLSCLPAICKDLRASSGLMGRAAGRRAGEQGVIYHCQEICCTQQGRLSSLLLLQLELQILKSCRTCTLQITIHHLGSGSQEETPPHVRLSRADFSSRNLEPGDFRVPDACPSQFSSQTIY